MQTHYIIWGVVLLIAIIILLMVLVATFKRKRKNDSEDTIDNQIYVGNLPYRIREQEITTFFSQYGNVQDAKIVKNIKTGRSRGYAFVTFEKASEANDALQSHGKRVSGRKIIVRIAKIPRKSIAITY